MPDKKNNTFTLDRIENDKAVLIAGREEVLLPKKYLPREAKEGEFFTLLILSDKGEREKREKSAKELLNEILSSGKDKK